MRTFPQKSDATGNTVAFEIENAYISVPALARILSTVKGVDGIETRRLFGKSPDIHVRFKYEGVPCVVYEPYGDSSVYWIGPEDSSREISAHSLEEAFSKYSPPFLRRFFGDLVHLRLFGRR